MLKTTLKYLRAKRNITQQELANALNVSKGAVAMWETEKRSPDNETLIKIATYFNVSIDYLLGNNIEIEYSVTKDELTEQEKTLLETFRSTTEFGRHRIIQSALNIYDEIEKKDTTRNTKNSG